MKLLLINIKELVQVEDKPRKWVSGKDMARINTIKNAFLLITDELITDFGPMIALEKCNFENFEQIMEIDCTGRMVFPAFCDPDSHLLYPFENDLNMSLRNRNSGSAKRDEEQKRVLLHQSGEEELYLSAMQKIKKIVKKGTGALEIKSGYGLAPDDELKMLRVIKRLKQTSPLAIISTFLGNEMIPNGWGKTPSNYFATLTDSILPQVLNEKLADNIDIGFNNNYHSNHTAEQFLRLGIKAGLKPKIHSGEIGLGKLRNKSLSQEIEIIESQQKKLKDKIAIISKSQALPVIHPGVSFFGNKTSTSARAMIDAGLAVALASDYNPVVTTSFDMKLMMSLGCIRHGMTAEEAINAATINAAYAMDISKGYGSVAKGKAANIFITEPIPTYQYLTYAIDRELIDMVILAGEIQ